jgi:hypothetical protein
MDIYVVKEEIIDRSRSGRRSDKNVEEKIRKEKVAEKSIQQTAYHKMRDVDLEKGASIITGSMKKQKNGKTPEMKENRNPKQSTQQRPTMIRMEPPNAGNNMKPPAMLLAPLSPKAISDGKKSLGFRPLGVKKSTSSSKERSLPPPPLSKKSMESRTPARTGGKPVVSPGLQLPSFKKATKALPAIPGDK